MADLTSTRGKIQDALDEADAALGQPTTSSQLAALQAQLDAANATITQLNADKSAMQVKIDAAKAAAQADKDADAANVAGQGVLDALA